MKSDDEQEQGMLSSIVSHPIWFYDLVGLIDM